MRTIFLGTPAIAVPFLERLHQKTSIVVVITSPDQPSGRGYELKAPQVKVAAQKLSLSVLQPETLKNPSVADQIRALGADVGIVVAYGKLLPKVVLGIPKHGFLNVHFSLLPKYRGAAPIQWALVNGEKETGVTLMDCQEGFEPLTFTDEVYHRWKPNYKGPWRFAYDELKERPQVLRVMEMLKAENQKKKRVYVLIGNEPYEACMSRIYETIEKGCDPHAQAFIPLNSLDKEPQAKFDWTVQKLKDVCRWTNAWMWKKVKFEDYDRHMKTSKVGEIAARRMSQEVLL